MAFPYEQYDPQEVIDPVVKVILSETKMYRNVVLEKMVPQIKEQMEQIWKKKTDDELGKRHEIVQKAYDIEPGTKAEDC